VTWPEGLITSRSRELYERSCKVIPAGVSSNIRGYPTHDPYPIFFERGQGSRFEDVDGNEYLDYLMSYGALILGHRPSSVINAVKSQMEKGTMCGMETELTIKVAERIAEIVPNADMVRFTNSGTESTMNAIRFARAYTGKEKILTFEGTYHGAHDYVMIVSTGEGSEWAPMKRPASSGIPEDILKLITILPWNNLKVLEKTIKRQSHELAAIICEPVMLSYAGYIPPEEGYLEAMRELTEENDIVLIFDEVITGFRLALGGAQEHSGIKADMATFAKGLGGGFPIGAITGKKEIMQWVRPGKVVHSGTFNSNPLSLAAAYAVLDELASGGMKHLNKVGNMLWEGVREGIDKTKTKAIVQGEGAAGTIYFTELKKITNHRERETACNAAKYKQFHRELLKRGIYWGVPYPSSRAMLSTAHTEDDIEETVSKATEALKALS